MQSKLSAEQTLLYLIDYVSESLEEIKDPDGTMRAEYIKGLRTAYVECLEIAQRWEKAEEHGLDWDIEENFPV